MKRKVIFMGFLFLFCLTGLAAIDKFDISNSGNLTTSEQKYLDNTLNINFEKNTAVLTTGIDKEYNCSFVIKMPVDLFTTCFFACNDFSASSISATLWSYYLLGYFFKLDVQQDSNKYIYTLSYDVQMIKQYTQEFKKNQNEEEALNTTLKSNIEKVRAVFYNIFYPITLDTTDVFVENFINVISNH